MSEDVPWIVRSLLRLYPRGFRDAHERELLDFVRDDAARRIRGRWTGLRFWLATSLDLVRGAYRAGRARPEETSSHRDPRLPSLVALLAQWPREVRHSLRTLAKTPLVSLVIVATLGLGVGLNVAIFSVVQAVLLEPLPYRSPEQLYYLASRWSEAKVERASHAGAELAVFRRESRAFADVAGVTSIRQNLADAERPRQVQVGWASSNLFKLLGVEPALGPGFAEDSPAGTLVLSFELWRDRYGSDPETVGRVVRLDGHPYTVTGVLPPGFQLFLPDFPSHIDVWKTPDDWWQNGDLWSADGIEFALLDLIGRLRDGATPQQAQLEMEAFAKRFREERIAYERVGVEYRVAPLDDTVAGEVRPTLFVLFGAVALVLLIACANVMNLLLARSAARGREIGLRLALGASRSRIAWSLLTESLILACAGGLAGLLVSVLATDGLQGVRPEGVPRLDEVAVDGNVLRFALVVSLLSILVFGLVPALYAARGHVAGDALSARSTAGRARGRLRGALVVTQLSLSLVLLIGAGLLTRSLQRLTDVQPGFDPQNLLTFSVSLPGTSYERPEGTNQFLRQLEARIDALPGVERVGVIWPLPLSGRQWSNTYVGGAVVDGERAYADYRLATPDLFAAMRIPLRRGRTFAPGDPRHVVVVSHRLAERAWPGVDAIGQVVQASPWGGGAERFEVVGVVGDVRSADLREPTSETIYFDSMGWSWTDWEVDYAVRTQGAPSNLVEPIREEIAALDPSIPMARVRSMDGYLDDHLASNRFALSLIGLFAVVAGVLAAVGLYGVLSYAVSQRSREIGVRMALGAGRSRILSWVLRHGLILIGAGIALGVFGALLVTRFLASILYDVAATDPWTFTAIALGFSGVGVLAAGLPALRATRVEPVTVLRAE